MRHWKIWLAAQVRLIFLQSTTLGFLLYVKNSCALFWSLSSSWCFSFIAITLLNNYKLHRKPCENSCYAFPCMGYILPRYLTGILQLSFFSQFVLAFSKTCFCILFLFSGKVLDLNATHQTPLVFIYLCRFWVKMTCVVNFNS